MIEDALQRISAGRIRHDLFYLCDDPLPFRKANYTRPGQAVSSLCEADRFLRAQLESAGCTVTATTHRAQAFRCDEAKPIHHWYSTPEPSDPWYDVVNLTAALVGSERPEEIIQVVSHKDSMSWIDSPGAHDNAVGTVANLELARVLATLPLKQKANHSHLRPSCFSKGCANARSSLPHVASPPASLAKGARRKPLRSG